jgi:murein DD-endopeptidase MepM/ murein hydrolase activator NlpD
MEEENSFLFKSTKLIEQVEVIPIILEQKSTISETTNYWLIFILSIYIATSTIFLILFIRNMSPLFSKSFHKGEKINKMKIYYHNNSDGIYSFFNRLYLPNRYKSEKLNSSIIRHELAHFNQLHSLDVLFIELSTLVFWFNPAIWFLRKEIKTNHEFLADQSVLRQETSNNYLQILLTHISTKQIPALGSNFSYLSIKTRIKMIQKSKKNTIQKTLNISLVLLISISAISLFSFKTIELERNIGSQLSQKFEFDLFKRPTGTPILIDQIKKVSSEFGMRNHPITKTKKLHTGVDLIATEGTEIIAVGKGTIVKASFSKNYGNHIVIQHNAKYSSLYAHLKSMTVKEGDFVEMNKVIGIIGNTGKSIKTHLHFELIENGIKVDPALEIGC